MLGEFLLLNMFSFNYLSVIARLNISEENIRCLVDREQLNNSFFHLLFKYIFTEDSDLCWVLFPNLETQPGLGRILVLTEFMS